MPFRGDVHLGVIDIDMMGKVIDRMFKWEVKTCFAIFPTRMDSGKVIWLRKYIRRGRWMDTIRDLDYKYMETQLFTPQEYTLWLLKQESSKG